MPGFPWEICACYEKNNDLCDRPGRAFFHFDIFAWRPLGNNNVRWPVWWKTSAHHANRLLFFSKCLIRSCHLNIQTVFPLSSERLKTTLWCQIMWAIVLEGRSCCRSLLVSFCMFRRIPFRPVVKKKNEEREGILPIVCRSAQFPLFSSGQCIS